jgi:hypothetical protein
MKKMMMVAELKPITQSAKGVVHNPTPLVTLSGTTVSASTLSAGTVSDASAQQGCSDKESQAVIVTDPGNNAGVNVGDLLPMIYRGQGKICHQRKVIITIEDGSQGKVARFVKLG